MTDIRRAFDADGDGLLCVEARATLVDSLLAGAWADEIAQDESLGRGVSVVAVGGYGRAQLFPCSDIDLLFCAQKIVTERAKVAIRRVSQMLWDCGMRVAPVTRTVAECARFTPSNVEFALALLDRRLVAGDASVFALLDKRLGERSIQREAKALHLGLLSLTRERYAKYGNTLFHLEPNIKECPGGLRDANVCGWLEKVDWKGATSAEDELAPATAFLIAARCFLHFQHKRDDNVLDWQAQDEAAKRNIGLPSAEGRNGIEAAFWMRAYFRHARTVTRALTRSFDLAGLRLVETPERPRSRDQNAGGIAVEDGRIVLGAEGGHDQARDPECVLAAFALIAKTGAPMAAESEASIEEALSHLSAAIEEGPALWKKLCELLTGRYAGVALRAMHALGLLELIVPEFHGIDALVIRDSYHRYTVDEHTFVLIDTLHGLGAGPGAGAPHWRVKFGSMLRELQHPGLLYLAALLHDTGKGRAGGDHARESARLAKSFLARLEMDAYETDLVVRLIETHLEMSAALRRDIFDGDAVRTFAARVQTHEALRMLTLFTYADIQAVHPDALTPWKAENLWRLSMNAANQIDRNVDEERIFVRGKDERVTRVLGILPKQGPGLEMFLEGFPERYLKTRSPEEIVRHFEMSMRFDEKPFQIVFTHGASMSEITLVTRDRPQLFASVAAALAAWGMNVITADAFANASGVVVDNFRFVDTFRTLELNAGERERFVASVRELISGTATVDAEKMLSSRKRVRRPAPRTDVETKVDFDQTASSHSTLLQVVAQDVPGLLRALSVTLSRLGHNVEVALVDTEGETAIDVFYLTHGGAKLTVAQQGELEAALVEAIDANAK